MFSYPPLLTTQRLELAVYLAHIRLSDGTELAHWSKVRYCCALARRLLRRYLAHPLLPDELLVAAHQASEALRATPEWRDSWPATRTHALEVLPVVLQVLNVLCNQEVEEAKHAKSAQEKGQA
ncbi:MAG: hypothetical protein ACRYFZ_15960 [Janthinobacterium lividum]